ncbi:Tripartite motif-containing protein 56 [Aphelenchoides avenae]|nr:Tripartite motif-containing protein 56 [Aphelenchus avenae]
MSDVDDRILEQLECPVCYEFYREPRVFSKCGHTACATCIGRMIAANKGKKKTVSCPQCRVKSSVPAGGFKTNYLVTCIAEKIHVEHARGPCAVCKRRTNENNIFECVTCKEKTPNGAAADIKILQMCSLCALEHHTGHYIAKSKDPVATTFVQAPSASGIVEYVPGSPSILPSPPISAFRLFKKQNADRIRQPGMTDVELSAHAHTEWNALGAAEKSKWEEMAQLDKARYERQIQEYRERVSKRTTNDTDENDDVSTTKTNV